MVSRLWATGIADPSKHMHTFTERGEAAAASMEGAHARERSTDAEGVACLGCSVGVGLKEPRARREYWGACHILVLQTSSGALQDSPE